MSEKINFNKKEENGEYNIPEYHIANWRDDIPEQKEAENKEMLKFEIFGKNEKSEREYIAPKEVSQETLQKIKRMKIGHRIVALS